MKTWQAQNLKPRLLWSWNNLLFPSLRKTYMIKVRTENKWPKLTVPTASLNAPYPGIFSPPAQHANPTRQMDYKCVEQDQGSINLNTEEQKLPRCINWAWEAVPFSWHLSSAVTAQSLNPSHSFPYSSPVTVFLSCQGYSIYQELEISLQRNMYLKTLEWSCYYCRGRAQICDNLWHTVTSLHFPPGAVQPF